MKAFFEHPLVWSALTALLLAACLYVPIRVKNDALRNLLMRWFLVPVSLVIIFYTYPVGIEIFKRWAVNFR